MTKIEEVARAILAKVPTGYGMTESEALEYARAAIEAMRTPTEAMKVNGGLAIENAMFEDNKVIFEVSGSAWQAMIDSALSEGDAK